MRNLLLLILLTGLIIQTTVPAQSQTEAKSESFQHANEILMKMSNYLAGTDHFSFSNTMSEDRLFTKDYYLQSEVRTDVTIRRPDKVYVDISSDYNHKRFWYDGQKITLLTVPANFYATAEANGKIDEMIDFVYDNFGVQIPMATLAFEDPYAALMEGVVDGYYTGLHNVKGVSCHHLLFINEDAEWQIWIEDGAQSVPRKYAVKYAMDGIEYRFTAFIDNWDFNPNTPDEMFNFVAPPESGVIEFVK